MRAAVPATRCEPPAQIDQCLADECSMSSVKSESHAGSMSPVARPAITCTAKSCQRLWTKTYEKAQPADARKPSMRHERTCSWNHGRVPMSVITMPVAIENTAKAMPASRMLPPTFSVKAEYIGTSMDSAKVVRKLIFRSSRASRETDFNIIEAKPRRARELYAVPGRGAERVFPTFSWEGRPA